MKKLNLKEIEIYRDITKTQKEMFDFRLDFSNLIYINAIGIMAHNLALKLYNSDGEIELTEEEVELVKNIVNSFCIPAFIDAINEQLKDQDND